ncbi:pentapeptide repeat-containing protein [Streptomyces microflavus]|uniref:pentapeptide repeat-containing protein n=1 Tax=Streptomyces microflavus TaxID=1919 RepID=UPI0035D72098
MSTPEPPPWPQCAHGATPAANPVGCRGIHIPGHTMCLAHLTDTDRDAYLASLTPGADIDLRGTTFTDLLLRALRIALHDPATSTVIFGTARFESATFEHTARFESATFEHTARFESATFHGDARFHGATFHGEARFESATFEQRAEFAGAAFRDDARFDSATFHGSARFDSATFKRNVMFGTANFEHKALFRFVIFQNDAWFVSAIFKGDPQFESAIFHGDALFVSVTFELNARFGSATFHGDAQFAFVTFKSNAWFGSATFHGDALFRSATFEKADRFGPLVCAGQLVLSGATFGGPVTLEFAARRLECRRTRWAATAEIRLRYTTVDFAHAVFEYPLTIAAEPDPFVLSGGSELVETAFAGAPGPDVRLSSLRGVDAAHLVLADVDLSPCLFTGTVHLDQLRLEGACTFDTTPPPRRLAALATRSFHRAPSPGRGAPLACRSARGGAGLERRGLRGRAGGAVAVGSGVPGAAQGFRGREARAGGRRLLLRGDGDAPPRRRHPPQ